MFIASILSAASDVDAYNFCKFYLGLDRIQEKDGGKNKKKSLKLASPISFYYLCGVSSFAKGIKIIKTIQRNRF